VLAAPDEFTIVAAVCAQVVDFAPEDLHRKCPAVTAVCRIAMNRIALGFVDGTFRCCVVIVVVVVVLLIESDVAAGFLSRRACLVVVVAAPDLCRHRTAVAVHGRRATGSARALLRWRHRGRPRACHRAHDGFSIRRLAHPRCGWRARCRRHVCRRWGRWGHHASLSSFVASSCVTFRSDGVVQPSSLLSSRRPTASCRAGDWKTGRSTVARRCTSFVSTAT
jgi:hypothetical protein